MAILYHAIAHLKNYTNRLLYYASMNCNDKELIADFAGKIRSLNIGAAICLFAHASEAGYSSNTILLSLKTVATAAVAQIAIDLLDSHAHES